MLPDTDLNVPLAGIVAAVSLAPKHSFSKAPQLSIMLVADYGIEGDAHAGPFVRHRYLARRNPRAPNLRQVHLIPIEIFSVLWQAGHDVRPGDLGENIATTGLNLEKLPLGAELRFGAGATVRLTGLRTPCVLIDRFQAGLKKLLLAPTPGEPLRAGVMAVVIRGGEIAPGDRIEVSLPNEPHEPLLPL
jgi:MOSC domain-containing protein YiiM